MRHGFHFSPGTVVQLRAMDGGRPLRATVVGWAVHASDCWCAVELQFNDLAYNDRERESKVPGTRWLSHRAFQDVLLEVLVV